MQGAIHRFVRLLRLFGVRVSVAEALDALTAAAQPGVLADRDLLRSALRVTLIKDRRDLEVFQDVFDAFFGLRTVVGAPQEHAHAHDDLSDSGELRQFTLGEDPGDSPEQGHSHGAPDDIRDYFRREDLSQSYNLHQEANKLDMASATDEIVLSNDQSDPRGEAARVQLNTRRLQNPGLPGKLTDRPGLEVDAQLSVAQEMALLGWLAESELPDEEGAADPADLAALRAQLAPLLAGLPERLREHLERLLAATAEIEERAHAAARAELLQEQQRSEIEANLRRVISGLHGAPRARRRTASAGTVDAARTMRHNMKYDGVPFRPITVAKTHDRPRLLVLADVSLSVRATAAFTLQVVHSLQSLVTSVRTFGFVAEVAEVTDLFAEHRLDRALELIMAGPEGGGPIDVDADSDYGSVFETFLEDYGSALNHRTTVLVLGDGRGNGHDPGLRAFEEITRRARSTLWLTPEPRFSWRLGRCDLPLYAEHCDRIHVVRGMNGLEDLSHRIHEPA
ncbi:VWA domain-containing protein [Calidifontibacter terrae]